VSDTTDASAAFRATGREIEELYAEAEGIRTQFGTGGWIFGAFVGLVVGLKLIGLSVWRQRTDTGGWVFGAFVGLVVGLKLIGLSVWRQRTDYEAGRAGCLACGRCYNHCPREHVRLEKLKGPAGGL